jgi:hypothetical protein
MEDTTTQQQHPTGYHPFPSHLLFDYMVEKMVTAKIATYEMAAPFRKAIPNRPFLWIPGRAPGFSLGSLMHLIQVRGMTGVNFLMWNHCTDVVTTPSEPYFMFDIEDGGAYLDTKTSLTEARIIAKGRSPYTILEGVFQAMAFSEALETLNMSLCGSRYKLENTPELLLSNSGPRLQSSFTDSPHPRWGTPSCKGRYTARDLGV